MGNTIGPSKTWKPTQSTRDKQRFFKGPLADLDDPYVVGTGGGNPLAPFFVLIAILAFGALCASLV